MSVHGPDPSRPGKPWRVAFRKPDGSRSTKRFATEAEARHFDVTGELTRKEPEPVESLEPVELPEGVFAYETGVGTRYRFNSNGTGRRGFQTPEAALLAKGAFEERHGRGDVAIGNERFEPVWMKFLAAKKPYLTEGSYENLERDGRLRLIPFFGEDRLKAIDVERVQKFLAPLAADVDDEEIAPHTVNNCLTNLSVFFNWCLPQKSIPVVVNPCQWVPHLPDEPEEMRFFTLAEIPRYYECCTKHYRPLAEFLIGTGARVSEAIAVKVSDLDLDAGLVRIYRQRNRRRNTVGTRATKGKRWRPVELAPGLVATLRNMLAVRAEHGIDDDGWLFLCPPPKRGRHARRSEPVPPHRKTVNDWHEAALSKFNARLPERDRRDVTLHGLRHTAAASWLATGHHMYFVQRQLGHRHITTTEKRYGHLERSYSQGAAAETERRIEQARLQARLQARAASLHQPD